MLLEIGAEDAANRFRPVSLIERYDPRLDVGSVSFGLYGADAFSSAVIVEAYSCSFQRAF